MIILITSFAMNKFYYIFFILSLLSFLSIAQNLKDTIDLQEIEVSASRFKNHFFQSGKKIQEIDSIRKEFFSMNSVSDILNYGTSVFAKNYAPGAIASTSIRGGNAQQTAVLWNGVNINHPMLGQADFSQYITALFDHINIEYGASSALWGSGAVNGNIQFDNTFSSQFLSDIKCRFGSFNTYSLFGKINFAKQKFQTYVKPYYVYSKNDYSIGDSLKLKNADFSIQGLMGGVSYQFNAYHHIQWHSWYNENNRHIPNNYFFNNYAANQWDKNFRNTLQYTYTKNKIKTDLKFSYLNDVLNYKDTLARINSYSNVHTFQTEEIGYFSISNNTSLSFGHQWIYNLALTNNYLNNECLNRHSVFAGWKQDLKGFRYNIILRKEWANIRSQIPFTGNVGFEYQWFSFLKLKGQASLFYRLPTLNDLFWKSSGNKDLKPESGYHYEGGIVWDFIVSSIKLKIHSEMTAFNKWTNNWIIWLPGGSGQPVPKNIAVVWSRGTETDNYLLVKTSSGFMQIGMSSAYVLSTIEKSDLENDASIGRQLIYTPRYNINGYSKFKFKNFISLITYQYVGYRFVSSDNLQWLKPYSVINFSGGYHFKFYRHTIQCIVGINNILNISYMIVSQRPMPGRNYFLQIDWNFE